MRNSNKLLKKTKVKEKEEALDEDEDEIKLMTPVVRFSRLDFNVQLRLPGIRHFECLKLSLRFGKHYTWHFRDGYWSCESFPAYCLSSLRLPNQPTNNHPEDSNYSVFLNTVYLSTFVAAHPRKRRCTFKVKTWLG
jgi:hypothetical protein